MPNGKVLIVENDPDVVAIAVGIIEDMPVKVPVKVVTSYKDAKDLIEQGDVGDYGIAFLDHHLNDGFGHDVLELLQEQFPGIKCVLMSGHRDPDEVRSHYPPEMDFLQKPFEEGALEAWARKYAHANEEQQ